MCYKRLQSLIQNLFFNCSLSFLCLARRWQNDHPISNEFSFYITYYISTRNIVWNNQIENDVWSLLFAQTGVPEKKFMQHSERYDWLVWWKKTVQSVYLQYKVNFHYKMQMLRPPPPQFCKYNTKSILTMQCKYVHYKWITDRENKMSIIHNWTVTV